MLSVPKHGWVDVSVGNWHSRASYLTDLPNELLDALIAKLQSWTPTCVKCDAEGWEFIIVFDSHDVHIIESKNYYRLISIEKNIYEVAEEVYKDISEHLYEWSLWDYDVKNKTKRIQNENKLKEKLANLHDALPHRNN
jgi:hypothetical protein